MLRALILYQKSKYYELQTPPIPRTFNLESSITGLMPINGSKFTLKLRWPTNSPLFFPSSFVYFNFSSKLWPNKLKQMQLTMKERSVPEYFLMKADRAKESPRTVADFSIFA